LYGTSCLRWPDWPCRDHAWHVALTRAPSRATDGSSSQAWQAGHRNGGSWLLETASAMTSTFLETVATERIVLEHRAVFVNALRISGDEIRRRIFYTIEQHHAHDFSNGRAGNGPF